jgi:cohesin domain-containing protein
LKQLLVAGCRVRLYLDFQMICNLLLMCVCCAAPVGYATTLTVVGPDGSSSNLSVPLGANFQVSVSADAYSDLYAWQFDLTWDPTFLALNKVTEGSALTLGGTTFFVPGTIVLGAAIENADTLVGAIAGAGGAHQVLAYFDFTATAVGTTSVSLVNVSLLNSNLNTIAETSVSGTASVYGAANFVPEPSYRWLVGVGLFLAFARCKDKIRNHSTSTLRNRWSARSPGAIKDFDAVFSRRVN